MAQSFACQTLSQNPFLGSKDKLANAALIKGNNIPAVSRTPTPAIILSVISALFSIARYLEDDLQQIFRTLLDSRPPALLLAPAPQFYEGPCEKSLKAWFPDVYWGKTHLECYNFF